MSFCVPGVCLWNGYKDIYVYYLYIYIDLYESYIYMCIHVDVMEVLAKHTLPLVSVETGINP